MLAGGYSAYYSAVKGFCGKTGFMPHPQNYSVSRLFFSDRGLLLTILNLSVRPLLALVVMVGGVPPRTIC